MSCYSPRKDSNLKTQNSRQFETIQKGTARGVDGFPRYASAIERVNRCSWFLGLQDPKERKCDLV